MHYYNVKTKGPSKKLLKKAPKSNNIETKT